MPFVVAPLAGLIVSFTGASVAVATAIADVLVYAAASVAINAVEKALSPKPKTATGVQLYANTYDPEAPLNVIYGSVRIGGMETIPPVTSGEGGGLLQKILSIAGHPVAGFWEAYANDQIIPYQKIGAVTGSTNDGKVTEAAFVVDSDPTLWLRRYDGTQTSVDWKLNNEVDSTAFSSSFVGKGIAYAAYQLWWNKNIWKSGVPTFTNIVQGAKVYDPRQDSTNGGSGSQRYTDSSTWTWSENPALCLANYLMSYYGGDYDATEIDWASVTTAANYCDAQVAVPSCFTTFADQGTCTHSGVATASKATGSDAWDSAVHSTDGHTGNIDIYASPGDVTSNMMVGLTSNSSPSGSYTDSGAHLLYFNASTGLADIYEAGTLIMTGPAYQAGSIGRVTYDGTFIRYYIDNVLLRTVQVGTVGQTQYFYAPMFTVGATMTLWVQKRFTCNGALASTAAFTDNITNLASTMCGRVIYRNGLWSLFAGSWQTPLYTINESDWVGGGLQIQFDGGRDHRFNRGRSWFIDPQKNWQRAEAFPRINSTYYADDGDEWIDMQTDFPYCVSDFQSQRSAEWLLRQSRNQIRVKGKLGPRWQRLNLWETLAINHALLGWSAKTFRVSQCTINPDSSVDVLLSEENSADWNDLTASDYDAPDKTPLQPQNPVAPSAPTGLTAISNVNGTIDFTITPPAAEPLNMRYQVWGSVNSVGPSILLADGAATFFRCAAPTSANHYWALSYLNVDSPSPWYPNTYGVVGTAGGLDYGQITTGAATELAGVTVDSIGIGRLVTVQVAQITVGPYPRDITVVVDAIGHFTMANTFSSAITQPLLAMLSTDSLDVASGYLQESIPANSTLRNPFMYERFFTLPASTTQTYYFNALNNDGGFGNHAVLSAECALKAEMIKL